MNGLVNLSEYYDVISVPSRDRSRLDTTKITDPQAGFATRVVPDTRYPGILQSGMGI